MQSTILNPFTVGGALSDPEGRGFYGRDEVFAFVSAALSSVRRVPILLQGQRRIGKSSILRQLQRHLPADFACVYFDLQGKATMNVDQVLYGLGRAIADRLQIDRPEREACTEDTFPRYLDRAEAHLGGRLDRLVLLFDEFDVIDQSFTGPDIAASRFIPYLAGLSASYPAVGYILVVGRKTEELSQELFGAILKDSVSHVIGRLTQAQTARLVTDSAAGNLLFEQDALTDIYNLTSGHPFCAQVLCHSIWTAALAGGVTSLPVVVTTTMVANALPLALESGALGLNWVYDGMSQPVHKLVLSAIAEVADPVAGEGATLDAIDRILRRSHISADPVALGRAPHELVSWDVLASSGRRFAYAVPMIGAWIRQNRTLAELQQRAVLANPRAQRYYDLALESLQQDNYDASIEDFRNALVANPSFIDALRGLGDALRLRGLPGDLPMAIEAHERILDLNPEEPRTRLQELLADGITQGADVATVVRRFERLKTLDDEGGANIQRASRVLEESARRHASYGSRESLKIARLLYFALGDEANAERTSARVRAEFRLRVGWAVEATVAALIVLGGAQVPGLRDLLTNRFIVGGLAAFAGSLFALSVLSEEWGGASWRFLAPVPLVVIAAGAVAFYAPSIQTWGIGLGGFGATAAVASRMFGARPAIKDQVTKNAIEITDPSHKLLEKLFVSLRPKETAPEPRKD